MPKSGWEQLLAGAPWFQDNGKFPIAAYSEFIPPPRLGIKPYSTKVRLGHDSHDGCDGGKEHSTREGRAVPQDFDPGALP